MTALEFICVKEQNDEEWTCACNDCEHAYDN